jgi:hypothetical protein
MMIKLPHLRGMYLWAKVGAVLCLGLLLAGCNRPPTPTPTPTPAAPTPTPAPTPKFPSTDPHVVRDKVIEFVRQKHPEVADLLGSPEWEGLPEPAVHAFAVFGYTSEKWRMDMTVLPAHLVAVDGVTLEEDTFDVELKYRSPPPYVIWTGEYAPDIDVQERHFVNREESRRAGAIAPEVARDLAFAYIVEQHSEADLPDQPWSEPRVKEGVWSSEYYYTAGNWRVYVTWSEYSSAYEIDAYYELVGGNVYAKIEWTVVVSADGEDIEEQHFNRFVGI